MIDIHCHLLYGVDDGPKKIEESIQMLKEAKSQGISAMILTPHYRHGMFQYPLDEIMEHYKKLEPYASELGIKLYLGCESHVHSRFAKYLQTGRCLTMAESSYVLTEYSYDTSYETIYQMTSSLMMKGYIPIIAHVERYKVLAENLTNIQELRKLGARIQVNADAILGKEGFHTKKLCKKLLKDMLIDFVASDSHGAKQRSCHLKECYRYIEKKYDKAYARKLMCENPKLILGEQAEEQQ